MMLLLSAAIPVASNLSGINSSIDSNDDKITAMSHAQILSELPRLTAAERAELFRRLCELQDEDLLHGLGPTESEKRLLDTELSEFERDQNPGSPWREAMARVRASGNR
jgi:hypothetical protein